MTETELEQSLRALYGALPSPEEARLAAILRRVEAAASARRRVGGRWLPWLVAGVVTAAAAAGGYGWYAVNRPSKLVTVPAKTVELPERRSGSSSSAQPPASESAAPEASDNRQQGGTGHTTVIYRH